MAKVNSQLAHWTGKFGQEYTDRNDISLGGLEKLFDSNFGLTRTELNRVFLGRLNRSVRILEVGSNLGNQLSCLQKMGFKNLYGVEPQEHAVELSKKMTKDINIIKGNAFDIPFKDAYFDLVFTSGVLIHIHPKDLKKALREIYRCTKKYIWGYEYYSENYTGVPYRERKGLLWKANFMKIYTENFPDLEIVKVKYLKYLKNNNTDIMFLLKKKHG